MTQVISLVAPPKAMTPATHSPMDLDERDAQVSRAFRSAADNTPDSSPSPRSASLGGKRAASISTSEASYERLEQLKINTPGSMNSDGSKDLICLCTPAPKIPRPRNAFILYRQHHQAQVVAQNPTLSNPEISKIIGEQWKEEAEHVKANWKGLADEEKQRHQHKYPDYRYQPRRGVKGQAGRPGSSPADDAARCPKCHGRSIATPRTPSTPYSTPTAARPGVQPYTSTVRDDADFARRGSYGALPPNRLRYTSQRPGPDEYGPESPEMKRRRFNTAGSYHSVSSPNIPYEAYVGRQTRAPSMGAPPQAMRAYQAAPLPEPGTFTRSRSGPMPPPPRPSVSGPSYADQGHHPGRHPSFDESLRLPPLQTSGPMSPSMSAEVDVRQLNTPVTGLGTPSGRDSQARSIEAMVMSIPFNRKLAVLSRISQPLSPPRPGSPGAEDRGAIIAVEGPKLRMLRQVGGVVEKALMTSGEVALKTFASHSPRERSGSDASNSERKQTPSQQKNFYTSYFQTMSGWHEKSQDIVHHITRRTPASPAPSENNDNEETKEKTPSRRGEAEGSEASEAEIKTLGTKIPVALLKEGFSLTLSDQFACTAPISDSYAPVDHWQWMATLWRGVVGPDLVVYVKPCVEEEIAKFGTVEYHKQRPGLIVVRIPATKDLDEATERRVAFEVIEWMRGGSFREGFGKA
ncbi:Fc.00g015240.m01.CDS01 [Cosmosporella sp. VM-42]